MTTSQQSNTKRVLIDKANSTMVASIAIAGFLIMFSIVASRALLSQRGYQARVITEKEKAVKQLDDNITAVDKLAITYQEFIKTPDNVIGGNPTGVGDKDGNNAKIVLDALPSKYDFPAFITSVQKLLSIKNFTLENIGGNDEETKYTDSKDKDPVEIPFQISSTVENYGRAKELLTTLEQSIRPIKVNTVTIGGEQGTLSLDIDAVSYFKASRGLTIEKKEVK